MAEHPARERSAAFRWLQQFATQEGAPPEAGVALDEWHRLAMAAVPQGPRLTDDRIMDLAREESEHFRWPSSAIAIGRAVERELAAAAARRLRNIAEGARTYGVADPDLLARRLEDVAGTIERHTEGPRPIADILPDALAHLKPEENITFLRRLVDVVWQHATEGHGGWPDRLVADALIERARDEAASTAFEPFPGDPRPPLSAIERALEGWRIERTRDSSVIPGITIQTPPPSEPNQCAWQAWVTPISRNPENVLYLLADTILKARGQ